MSDLGRLAVARPASVASSLVVTTRSSSGIGCFVSANREQPTTHLAIDLVLLLRLGRLLLDHEDRVVEEEDLELGALRLRPAALLEPALEDHLPILLAQLEVDRLAWPEDELLIELGEREPVLRLARLLVDAGEEVADELDDARQDELVRVIVGRVLEHGLEEERVAGQSRRRLGQVAVEFELARFRCSLEVLDSQPGSPCLSHARRRISQTPDCSSAPSRTRTCRRADGRRTGRRAGTWARARGRCRRCGRRRAPGPAGG